MIGSQDGQSLGWDDPMPDGGRMLKPDKLPQCIWIEWEDSAQAASPWQWLEAIDGPSIVTCLSVGFVVAETAREVKLAISVAGRHADAEQAAGIIAIPTACVVRRGVLTFSSLSVCDPGVDPAPNQLGI